MLILYMCLLFWDSQYLEGDTCCFVHNQSQAEEPLAVRLFAGAQAGVVPPVRPKNSVQASNIF